MIWTGLDSDYLSADNWAAAQSAAKATEGRLHFDYKNTASLVVAIDCVVERYSRQERCFAAAYTPLHDRFDLPAEWTRTAAMFVDASAAGCTGSAAVQVTAAIAESAAEIEART